MSDHESSDADESTPADTDQTVTTGDRAAAAQKVKTFPQTPGVYLMKDAAGRVINYVVVKRNITREVSLEQQFLQAQKLEAVGQLAGGVAHDFNNMLAVILGRTQLALVKMLPADPYHKTFLEIQNAAEHSANLTRQLLAFARKQTVAPKVIDINQNILKFPKNTSCRHPH